MPYLDYTELTILMKYLRHVGNQYLADAILQVDKVLLSFERLPYAKQRELLDLITLVHSQGLSDRVANEWYICRETYDYSRAQELFEFARND